MNEKQRRALELLLSKDLAIGGGFGDKVPKHGGPYRGPREVSPLMKVGLYRKLLDNLKDEKINALYELVGWAAPVFEKPILTEEAEA